MPNRVIGEVENHMWQPLQVPPGVHRWLNFADRLDPVALDADLFNDFTPSDKVTDHRIKNPYRLNLRAGGPHTTLRTPPMFNPPREPISKKHCFR